jgi:hypothetical protein
VLSTLRSNQPSYQAMLYKRKNYHLFRQIKKIKYVYKKKELFIYLFKMNCYCLSGGLLVITTGTFVRRSPPAGVLITKTEIDDWET